MSWISENYEKAAIGGAAVVALAFGAVILKNKGAIDEAIVLPSVTPNNDVSVPGSLAIEHAQRSLSEVHEIAVGDLDGRKVDLFTGVPLFSKKDDPKNPVDLLKSSPVHAGIPNTWWIEENIDPGYADSPERDPDEDGFTNREEYTAETDPNDPAKHPNPIAKLNAVGIETTEVHLKASDFGGGQFTFKLQTKLERRVNKMPAEPIKEGTDIVFEKELMKNRFKFVRLEKKQVKKGGITTEERFWIIEDKQPNKKGVTYEIDRQGNPGIFDSTVEFQLNALGQEGETFKVPEMTRFSLPFDANATEKPYLLKSVDRINNKVEIEYTDKEGNTKTQVLDIKK
ncbi:hypothetical protein JIN77_01535 [Verrucomicrobiaceae bacterium R5-34]|nr:hypothetical protein [Verrucomicrobiaceae bacterium R5-34]